MAELLGILEHACTSIVYSRLQLEQTTTSVNEADASCACAMSNVTGSSCRQVKTIRMIKADMKSMRIHADLAQDQQASREVESVAERATQLEMSGYMNHTAEHSCGDLTSSQRTSGYATPATNVSSAGTVPFEHCCI